MEILKKAGIDFTLLYNTPPVAEIAKQFSFDQIYFQRQIDPKLHDRDFTKNYLNGHIPITAIWAFSALIIAVLYNYKYFIFSNERSSNYGNIEHKGFNINHQWSKSVEFEKKFSDYIREFISPDLSVFSILRPFYEIKIIRKFNQFSQYFGSFASCNRNFSTLNKGESRWCGQCPKCAFIFICLACFVDKNKIINIFGKHLLNDESLLNLYFQLIGEKDFKPFECVGLPEETAAAVYLLSDKKDWQDDFIMRKLLPVAKKKYPDRQKLLDEVFSYGDDSLIPDSFRGLLKEFIGM